MFCLKSLRPSCDRFSLLAKRASDSFHSSTMNEVWTRPRRLALAGVEEADNGSVEGRGDTIEVCLVPSPP